MPVGHGIWYPVNLLSAMVAAADGRTVGRGARSSFTPIGWSRPSASTPILSLGFGLAFALVLPRLPAIPGPIAWGGLLMPLLWTATSYGLMGVVNPVLAGARRLAVVHRVAVRVWHRGGDRRGAVRASSHSAGRARPDRRRQIRRDGDSRRDVRRDRSTRAAPAAHARAARCCCCRWPPVATTSPGKPNPANRPRTAGPNHGLRPSVSRSNCAGCHGADGKLGPAPPLNDPLFLAIIPDDGAACA